MGEPGRCQSHFRNLKCHLWWLSFSSKNLSFISLCFKQNYKRKVCDVNERNALVFLPCTALVFHRNPRLCNDHHVLNHHFQLLCPLSWWPSFLEIKPASFHKKEITALRWQYLTPSVEVRTRPSRSDKQCTIASFLFLFPFRSKSSTPMKMSPWASKISREAWLAYSRCS